MIFFVSSRRRHTRCALVIGVQTCALPISCPVAVDRHDDPAGIPVTMARYGLRGTPSLLLIDRRGRLRLHRFGHVPDLAVGAAIQQLLDEGEGEGVTAVTESGGERCAVGSDCG